MILIEQIHILTISKGINESYQYYIISHLIDDSHFVISLPFWYCKSLVFSLLLFYCLKDNTYFSCNVCHIGETRLYDNKWKHFGIIWTAI